MYRSRPSRKLAAMPVYLLHHEHEPHECAAAFAAWAGRTTPIEIREIEIP